MTDEYGTGTPTSRSTLAWISLRWFESGPSEESLAANRRIRSEGTRNLLAAAEGVKAIAQSTAFPPGAAEHEKLVLDAGGVIVRYGVFYGPGTYSGDGPPPPPPRIHVDDAARRTVDALDAPRGTILTLADA